MPAHFDLSITAKSTPSKKQVVPPTNTKSFQEMIKEIDALTAEVSPIPEYIDSSAMDNSESMNTETSSDVNSLLNTNESSPQ